MIQKRRIFRMYFFVLLMPFLIYFFPFLYGKISGTQTLVSTLVYLPWILLGVLGFLGLKLNQTRILLTALVLAGAYWVLGNTFPYSAFKLPPEELVSILTLSLPLSLSLIFIFPESRLWSEKGLARLLVMVSPALALLGMFYLSPEAYQRIMGYQIMVLRDMIKFPHLALAGSLLFILEVYLVKDRNIRLFIEALCFILLGFLGLVLVYTQGGFIQITARTPWLAGLALTFMAGVLLHTVFLMFWQKVYLDELTGIPNRRSFDEQLQHLGGEYTLAMIDIDHFKHFNDSYGHEEGDHVLRLVAQHIQREFGQQAFRYGGEEFCAILKESGLKEAQRIADKARKKLEQRPFHIRKQRLRKTVHTPGDHPSREAFRNKDEVQITVSIGLAAPSQVHKAPMAVLGQADQALYKAKAAGRNCVIVS